jgi:ABC-type Fe3+-hydroxamate transport system substrate-binding protein
MQKKDIARQQKQAIKFWSEYDYLPAVKNNSIYVIDPDTILRLGPRTPQGLRKIAELIHKN